MQIDALTYRAWQETITACNEAHSNNVLVADKLAAARELIAALPQEGPDRKAYLELLNGRTDSSAKISLLELLKEPAEGEPALNAEERVALKLCAPALLELRPITQFDEAIFDTLIKGERVHPIQHGHEELKRRLPEDNHVTIEGHHMSRQAFGLFYPGTDQPVIVTYTALFCLPENDQMQVADTRLPNQINDILAGHAEPVAGANTVVFYSISNFSHENLRGIPLGKDLLTRVQDVLSGHTPHVSIDPVPALLPSKAPFVTLSPIPSFRQWLDEQLEAGNNELFSTANQINLVRLAYKAGTLGQGEEAYKPTTVMRGVLDHAQDIPREELIMLETVLQELAAEYLACTRSKDDFTTVRDPVGNFHLGNGAYLANTAGGANDSPAAWEQSYGVMANYRYGTPEQLLERSAHLNAGGDVTVGNIVALVLDARMEERERDQKGDEIRLELRTYRGADEKQEAMPLLPPPMPEQAPHNTLAQPGGFFAMLGRNKTAIGLVLGGALLINHMVKTFSPPAPGTTEARYFDRERVKDVIASFPVDDAGRVMLSEAAFFERAIRQGNHLAISDTDHHAPEIPRAIARALPAMKRAGLTDVFIEFDDPHQKEIDDFMKTGDRKHLYFFPTETHGAYVELMEACRTHNVHVTCQDKALQHPLAIKYFDEKCAFERKNGYDVPFPLNTAELREGEGLFLKERREVNQRWVESAEARRDVLAAQGKPFLGLMLGGSYHFINPEGKDDVDEMWQRLGKTLHVAIQVETKNPEVRAGDRHHPWCAKDHPEISIYVLTEEIEKSVTLLNDMRQQPAENVAQLHGYLHRLHTIIESLDEAEQRAYFPSTGSGANKKVVPEFGTMKSALIAADLQLAQYTAHAPGTYCEKALESLAEARGAYTAMTPPQNATREVTELHTAITCVIQQGTLCLSELTTAHDAKQFSDHLRKHKPKNFKEFAEAVHTTTSLLKRRESQAGMPEDDDNKLLKLMSEADHHCGIMKLFRDHRPDALQHVADDLKRAAELAKEPRAFTHPQELRDLVRDIAELAKEHCAAKAAQRSTAR